MPLSSDSTSNVTFSLSMANNGSPTRTVSPFCFSQPVNVPSSIDHPRRGTVISIGMARGLFVHQLPDGGRNSTGVGDHGRLEGRAVGCGCKHPMEAADRSVQIIKACAGHLRRYLRREAARA